jgi:hypothetical protein
MCAGGGGRGGEGGGGVRLRAYTRRDAGASGSRVGKGTEAA